MTPSLAGTAYSHVNNIVKSLESRDWILILVALAALAIVHAQRNSKNLPPGPKGLPLIGNVLQMPRNKEWLVYNEWAKKFGALEFVSFTEICIQIHTFFSLGPIFHVKLFSEHVIVINSHKVSVDVLEKNANSYAARPCNMVMATDL